MTKKEIIEVVRTNDRLKQKLFCRGFLITNDGAINMDEYPFYALWGVTKIRDYSIVVHPLEQCYITHRNTLSLGLIGHAYDPVIGETSEPVILNRLADSYCADPSSFFGVVNQLTGVFAMFVIKDHEISVLSDATGLQSIFYCKNRDKCYFSSHANLIGDLLSLAEDDRVTKLKNCATFKYFGNQLPGNITQFAEVQRVVPNHYAIFKGDISQVRFYYPHYIDTDVETICGRFIDLMQNTMHIIPRKWERPAISLTGGVDSKTTLACTKEDALRYAYFSYDSQKNEAPDALAASKIARAMQLPFKLYRIPYEDDAFPNEEIEGCRKILLWNGGDIRENNPNDVRKRLYFDHVDDFDVEVKSWVSEIGRARYTKRYYGKRTFGSKPTPRKCTTFYKFLLFSRENVRYSDSVFEEYIERYFESDISRPVPWQDQFYWEWHWPSRDGLCLTSEQRYAYDITVPYNNRKILELLLSAPQEMRVSDTIYAMVRQRLDPRIDGVTGTVTDANHTKLRGLLETAYYCANLLLP